MRALLKDKLKTDVEKNPGPTSQAQRQARNTRRKRRRARRGIKKVLTLQKEWNKGNKTISTWNIQRPNIHGRKFGEIAKLCKRSGMDIIFMTELNTISHVVKKFEIYEDSMYLLHSRKKGVLMREIKNEIAKMKDASLGEDEIRLRYIREAGDEIRKSVYRKIQWLWEASHADGMTNRKLE